jgi:hypothetical protein
MGDIIFISLLIWSVWGFILRLQLTDINEEHKGFRYWLMTCSLGFIVLFMELCLCACNGSLKRKWDKFIRNHNWSLKSKWNKFMCKIVDWVNK